jgi:hypothetical protein
VPLLPLPQAASNTAHTAMPKNRNILLSILPTLMYDPHASRKFT